MHHLKKKGYKIEIDGEGMGMSFARQKRRHGDVHAVFWIGEQEAWRLEQVLAELVWKARQAIEAFDMGSLSPEPPTEHEACGVAQYGYKIEIGADGMALGFSRQHCRANDVFAVLWIDEEEARQLELVLVQLVCKARQAVGDIDDYGELEYALPYC